MGAKQKPRDAVAYEQLPAPTTRAKPEGEIPIPPTQLAGETKVQSPASESTRRLAEAAAAPAVKLPRLGTVDEAQQRAILEQLNAAAQEQAEKKINYGVEQGIEELRRAQEDASVRFQTQRNSIAAEELRALDNQALYAEARGDRGGIGQAQYGAVRNAAAQNRLAVDREQTRLSTDTARRIADLRAEGEFDKADKLLELSQSKLRELLNLRRWAEETELGVEEFNARLLQWEADYALSAQKQQSDTELNAAKLTGALSDGTLTLEAQTRLAQAGEAMLAAGLTPTRAQLLAMGWTEAQYEEYIKGRQSAASAQESARLTGPIYIRNAQGQLQKVSRREYREYLANRQ